MRVTLLRGGLSRTVRLVLFVGGGFAVLAASGCGGGETGPPRHPLSGTVRFNDEPVPMGTIIFTPDGAKGNSGPGSVASIQSGQYKTEPSKGVLGGAYIVSITGYDGVPVESGEGGMSPEGSLLFHDHQVQVDLPATGGTHDFEVPASAAK
jgi:hypothetical protein